MIPSATLEIHNKTNKTFEISVQESDLKNIKQGESLFFVVNNSENYPIIVSKLEKLGDLIATPTGHGTIFITFNSKVRDQEQVIGVYTSGRSNYHVIIAESTNELDKIVYDMFHYDEDADIFETWCSVDKNGCFTELFSYSW